MKGWLRLGVVLSLVWLLSVCTYVGFDYWRINSVEAGWEHVGRVNVPSGAERNPFDQFDEPAPKSFFVICGAEAATQTTTCSLRINNFLFVAVGPIFAVWLVAVLGGLAVLWVRAGFRGDA